MLEEALGRLEYAERRQLLAVVTGNCGIGKTTTVRLFKASLNLAMFLVMYLADSKLTPRHFYKGLLEQLGSELQHLLPVFIVYEAYLIDTTMWLAQ